MTQTAQGSGPAPCPSPFNLADHVLRHAARLGAKPALIVAGSDPARDEVLDYAGLRAAVLGIAAGLLRHGARPGDRVLLRLDNTPDFPLAYLAALAVDLVPVPSSAQLTAREVSAAAALVAPRLVIHAPGLALPEEMPQDALPPIPLADLRAMHRLPPAPIAMGDPERPGYIVFTSGTGGQPRAVLHAHRAVWARQMMVSGWYGLRESDRLMHAGAFNWTYTLGTGLMDPWAAGATALIPAPGSAPADLPALLARLDATIFAAAPGVYRQILRSDIPPMPALRHGLSAGEKLPDALRARWQATTGRPIHEAYGMSECSTFVSGAPDAPAPQGTLGRPQPGRRVAILGAEGEAPLPPDMPGQLAIHRTDPGLMLGYYGDPGATARKMRGPWFLTGDSAAMDPSGAITYLGREDDLMNAGGYRVSPVEVEEVLAGFPGIAEAAAAEIEVKPGTTVIGAFYASADPLDETALAAHCAGQLARYKCPRLFRRLPALPRGRNNKLLRGALRRQFALTEKDPA